MVPLSESTLKGNDWNFFIHNYNVLLVTLMLSAYDYLFTFITSFLCFINAGSQLTNLLL